MNMTVDLNVSSNDPRTRARFQSARKKAKKFIVERRGYRVPDFNRMILDLRNLGWSHEKIAFVLDIQGGSTVSAWATGSVPDYVHGEQFVMLWREQTGIYREPRKGEWTTYKYDIGQLNFLDQLDNVIDQLDEAQHEII